MDDAKIQALYTELETLTLDLPADPAGMGPDFLKEQISLCRNYLNRVSFHLQRLLQEVHLLSMDLDSRETALKIKSDELLASDIRVRGMPSIEDRHAMVSVILAEDNRDIQRVKREITSLKHLEKVIRLRKGELDNTMSAIRLQRSLLRDQIRSGSIYGDETETSRNNDPVDDLSSESLKDLLDETEAELAGTPHSVLQFGDETDTTQSLISATEDDTNVEATEAERPPKKPRKSKEPTTAQDVVEGSEVEPNEGPELDSDVKRFLEEKDDDDFAALLAAL